MVHIFDPPLKHGGHRPVPLAGRSLLGWLVGLLLAFTWTAPGASANQAGEPGVTSVFVSYSAPIGDVTDNPEYLIQAGDQHPYQITAKVRHMDIDELVSVSVQFQSGEENRATAAKRLAEALREKLAALHPGSEKDVDFKGSVITVTNTLAHPDVGNAASPQRNPNVPGGMNAPDTGKPYTTQLFQPVAPASPGSFPTSPLPDEIQFRANCSKVNLDMSGGLSLGGPGSVEAGQGIVDAPHRVVLSISYKNDSDQIVVRDLDIYVPHATSARGVAQTLSAMMSVVSLDDCKRLMHGHYAFKPMDDDAPGPFRLIYMHDPDEAFTDQAVTFRGVSDFQVSSIQVYKLTGSSWGLSDGHLHAFERGDPSNDLSNTAF